MKIQINNIKLKNFLYVASLFLLLLAIPIGVYLVQHPQIFKGRATTISLLETCNNKFIYGLNGPVNDKIKQLYTNPSIRFLAIGWKDIQPNANSNYNFSSLDNMVNEAIANGQTPSVKFCDGDCFPDWARQMDREVDHTYCCSTDYVCRILKEDTITVQAFKNVVGAMVTRYKDRITQWDYGIEPNCRGYNPFRYTSWLKSFYGAVKAADPQAVVIGGHLSGANIDYLSAMYANGAQPYFDYLALDPYGEPFDFSGLDRVRNLMVSRGDDNKKIWIGEWGISSGNDETRQANLIDQGLNYLASKPWIGAAFYHNYECELWADSCSPGSPGYLGFSLLRSDETTKPAYDVFKRAVSTCSSPTSTPVPTHTLTPTLKPNTTPTKTPTPTQGFIWPTLTPTFPPEPTLTQTPTPTKTPSPTKTPTPKPPTPTFTVTPTLTSIPTPAINYDLNSDSKINSLDVSLLLTSWRVRVPATIPRFDFNRDGVINVVDYSLLVRNLNL